MEWKNRKTHWYEAVSAALNFPFLKDRRIVSLLTLLSSKNEEVSQNCFVIENVLKFENEEVSQNCFVFDVVKFKN